MIFGETIFVLHHFISVELHPGYLRYRRVAIGKHLPPASIVAREPATNPGDVMELRMMSTPPAMAVSWTNVLLRELETCSTPRDL